MDDFAPPDSALRRSNALRDTPSALVGASLAVLVHLGVGMFALRAGAAGGNIAHAAAAATVEPKEEEIIEGALLRQGGGGEFDPRRIVHRQPPVRAEERATPQPGTGAPATPTPEREVRPRRDPNALVTERDILGRGNQDLAERLQRMAQVERESEPTTMPGPGAAEGSMHGTETDRERAGQGAQAKIRSFLQRNLRLPATAPAAARRPFRLSIRISADGSSLARGQVVQGSGDETVDADISLQLAQLVENHTQIPELTDEERAAITGRSYTVRYTPD